MNEPLQVKSTMIAKPVRTFNASPYYPNQGIRYVEPIPNELELKRASMITKRQNPGFIAAVVALIWHSLVFVLVLVLFSLFGATCLFNSPIINAHIGIYVNISALLFLITYGTMAYFNFESLINSEISTRPQGFKRLWPLIFMPCLNLFFFFYSFFIMMECKSNGDANIMFVIACLLELVSFFTVPLNIIAYGLFSEDAALSQSCLIPFKPYALVNPPLESGAFNKI